MEHTVGSVVEQEFGGAARALLSLINQIVAWADTNILAQSMLHEIGCTAAAYATEPLRLTDVTSIID